MAVKLANEIGITAVITNGNDFENLERIIEGDIFKGTVVMPYKIDASFYDREYYLGKKGGVRYGYVESLRGRIVYNLANFYRAFIIKLFLDPKTCLDVGCGTGYLVKWLRFFGIDAHGVEISQDALKLAKDSVKPYLKKGDILKLPYKDNQFELVLTFDVLEHLEKSKIPKAIDESIRVSKKYILHKIYTTENNWMSLFHGRDFAHLSVFPAKHWQKLFQTLDKARLVKGSFFRLPSFFETLFLLKKD
jgi:2-polyprenyl-3-methyl-5-hydroxy-6-metoxy-1,4-benzoquinol methylase